MALLTLLLLISQVRHSSATQSVAVGLLIGLHHREDTMLLNESSRRPSGGSLSTIWIPLDNPSALSGIKVGRVADLLLPRRSGFWRAGLLGTCAEEIDDGRAEAWVKDYLWFAPLGRTPTVTIRSDSREPRERVGPCRAPDIRCVTDSRTDVAWIWPEYASLNFSIESDCGAHPSWSSEPTLRDIDHPSQALTIAQTLGPSAEARMRDAFASAKREHLAEACTDFADPLEFDPLVWNIVRSPDQWRATGWAETHRLCGYGFDYAADVDLFSVTRRRPEEGTLLRQIRAAHPAVQDAHNGPAGWVLAIAETELLVVPRTSSDRVTVRVPIPRQDHVVMVEWATGSNVGVWSNEVLRIKSAAPVNPRVIVPPSVSK
jgi:hypothetical protein